MPLPLLLVGAAVIAGAYGVKKGLDAKSDFDDAEEINEDAQEIYENAQRSLEQRRNKTQKAVESLGQQKLSLFLDALTPFVETFSKIKNVDYEEGELRDGKLPDVSIDEVREVREVVLRMEEVIGGGALAGSASALAGLATFGSVGVLATASTGTAIAGLSGAAATNATLAWLGGGSLAAGGFGMAGGAAVLGGIVAAPVLLVGGLMMASKAEEAKENALSNRRKARAAATAMEEAEVAAREIGRKATQVRNVLKRLQDYLCNDLEALEDLVSVSTDYRTYDAQDKELVCRTASLAVTAKNLAETPLLEEDGSVTNAIRQEFRAAKRSLKALGA